MSVGRSHKPRFDGDTPPNGPVAEIDRTLQALESYAMVHFFEEERLMARCGYIKMKEHAQEHQDFTAQVGKVRKIFRTNPLICGPKILTYLSSWLIRHVKDSDSAAGAAILSSIKKDGNLAS
jgi:hemerythrin-like metal-binding protein